MMASAVGRCVLYLAGETSCAWGSPLFPHLAASFSLIMMMASNLDMPGTSDLRNNILVHLYTLLLSFDCYGSQLVMYVDCSKCS